MNLDEETLMEIEDYIKHLDEKIGLKAETMLDIEKAINRCRSELKNLHKANVIKSVCVHCGKGREMHTVHSAMCLDRMHHFEQTVL